MFGARLHQTICDAHASLPINTTRKQAAVSLAAAFRPVSPRSRRRDVLVHARLVDAGHKAGACRCSLRRRLGELALRSARVSAGTAMRTRNSGVCVLHRREGPRASRRCRYMHMAAWRTRAAARDPGGRFSRAAGCVSGASQPSPGLTHLLPERRHNLLVLARRLRAIYRSRRAIERVLRVTRRVRRRVRHGF